MTIDKETIIEAWIYSEIVAELIAISGKLIDYQEYTKEEAATEIYGVAKMLIAKI